MTTEEKQSPSRTVDEFPAVLTLRFESQAHLDAFVANLLDGRGENMASYYWHPDTRSLPGYWATEFWIDWVDGIDEEEET